ncbi:mitochondrial carrier homolog 2-like [Gigantopelta aegis]|uniref:mitochondrial carrier homolog 2-like n=1 Tax=Gigantopelta aegis TaxID=1735272 RepID=UPI001B88C16A|nr:mitochondrial carrier homolog 2-like [Gigantopelta aegis]
MSALVAAQYGAGALVTSIMHPLGYAKVLIQVGYEPLPPKPSVSLFGKETYVYPNIFQYIKHIKSVDGFWGLYSGVFPRIASQIIGNVVQSTVTETFKEFNKNEEEQGKQQTSDELLVWISAFCKETAQETVGRCLGIVVSHPFHGELLIIRYSVFSSISEIYRNDGVLGFFSGIVPRIVGEIITVWISNFLAQLMNKYLVEDKEMKSYTGAACGLVVSHVTYPFTLVTNIMAVNNSGLRAVSWKPYDSWFDCWGDLSRQGALKRGSSLFWRYYSGPRFSFSGRRQ